MQLAWLFFLMTIPGPDCSQRPEATKQTAKYSYFEQFDKSIKSFKQYNNSLRINQILKDEPPKITFSGSKETRLKLASDDTANEKSDKERDIPSENRWNWTMIVDPPITRI
jgi:hypothetical protein